MIYDITQPLFECEIYPGDPRPEKKVLSSTANGDLYNMTAISLCVHNGTHVDAPFHFIKDGKGIDKVSLEKFIGPAYVVSHEGEVSAEDAERFLKLAKEASECLSGSAAAGAAGGAGAVGAAGVAGVAGAVGAEKKILIKGDAIVTLEAAKVFAAAGIDLIGNESQSVGPINAPMAVHLVLLAAEVVLLEGIRLSQVPDGVYFLNCAPLNLTDTDGAPCRAILIK